MITLPSPSTLRLKQHFPQRLHSASQLLRHFNQALMIWRNTTSPPLDDSPRFGRAHLSRWILLPAVDVNRYLLPQQNMSKTHLKHHAPNVVHMQRQA